MPLPIDELIPEKQTEQASVETEFNFLAAGQTRWEGLEPDDYKAYVEFDICHSLPNVIGPEMHGRIFGYHPEVLRLSHQSLFHQQVNLGHLLAAYGHHEDRIVGAIVGVGLVVPKAGMGGNRPIPFSENPEDAVHIKAVAVVHKIAKGVDRFLGAHLSGRRRQSVSIEGTSWTKDYHVFDPQEKTFTPLEAAMELYGKKTLWFDKEKGLQVGKFEGRQLVLCPGGTAGNVAFRGTGFTPNPAEPIARITEMRAMEEEGFTMLAATACYEWEAGDEVKWSPLFSGMDAGRGTVMEVILEGTHLDHATRKVATPENPLLRVKVAGKTIEVLRHASSVEKLSRN